ncbi:hypothetical protein GRS96_16260 [Rathayibacter sp. VKM Ac-2803]|uniref:hypothetical protein n=1 Tax=unclassified Rathayibacter TaxID=2609250 RepID=UPI00135C9BA6|nr:MULTISPECIES: hypothetical protein [unclassified Rathayibacter]MWV50825.1 hypothetical protein [Rathayibacter sp. VKM Ac-2803]MWV57303.1 hypothetical protein [Rathayibacter sp. VKM Ac-2754]
MGDDGLRWGEAALYTDAIVTAPFALAVIAEATGSRVVGGRTADAHVPLYSGPTSARVSVAGFGDSVPVTVDVRDERGQKEARAAAQALGLELAAYAGWSITPGF